MDLDVRLLLPAGELGGRVLIFITLQRRRDWGPKHCDPRAGAVLVAGLVPEAGLSPVDV